MITRYVAEVFNKYFTSLFTSRTSVCDLLLEENEWCETGFKFRKLTLEDTQKGLKSLDKNKATGLDGVSAKCLRTTAPAIAGSLNHVFNLSLASGEISQEWKNAKVTPIFKAGSETNIENYRPISVHSKNSGMNFIPIEYDLHPNEFHTYGMNSASMTFIPTAVRSSYCECDKTSVIPKLRVNFTPCFPQWQTALLGQRSSKSVAEKSIHA